MAGKKCWQKVCRKQIILKNEKEWEREREKKKESEREKKEREERERKTMRERQWEKDKDNERKREWQIPMLRDSSIDETENLVDLATTDVKVASES